MYVVAYPALVRDRKSPRCRSIERMAMCIEIDVVHRYVVEGTFKSPVSDLLRVGKLQRP